MAGLFQVLWGRPDGTFRKAAELKGTDDEPLIIPNDGEDQLTQSICTRPMAVDWDNDGDLDLVVGNFAGTFYLFSGEGEGKFAPKPEPILSDGEPLRVPGAHGDPFPIDWDGDGDLDLLSGSASGGVHWAENGAGKGKVPELKTFETLIAAPDELPYGYRPDEIKAPAGSTRVWAADFDADGKLDVLVGDSVTLISPKEGVSDEEFAKRLEAWNQARKAAGEKAAGTTDADELQAVYEHMNEVYQRRTEFMDEERTGFVWLYRQK